GIGVHCFSERWRRQPAFSRFERRPFVAHWAGFVPTSMCDQLPEGKDVQDDGQRNTEGHDSKHSRAQRQECWSSGNQHVPGAGAWNPGQANSQEEVEKADRIPYDSNAGSRGRAVSPKKGRGQGSQATQDVKDPRLNTELRFPQLTTEERDQPGSTTGHAKHLQADQPTRWSDVQQRWQR